MTDDLTQPSSSQLRDDARTVVLKLREAGFTAYFAGGCVRDLLLGQSTKDYDVATDAPPNRVRQIFPRTQAVGAAFGVILVRQPHSVVEVATFRSDGAYVDGRHPTEVKFTTAEEDAQRRDFTINGLFLDPLDDDKIIDFVGGQDDLKAKVIRAIGDPRQRFAEDHLRILRAIRFAARLEFDIESETRRAMHSQAPNLTRISPERIADELRRMLSPTTRMMASKMLGEFAIDAIVFRFAEFPWCAPHTGIRQERRTVMFDRVQPALTIEFGTALAAATIEYAAQTMPGHGNWLELTRKLNVRAIGRALRQSLRLSNEESDALEGTLYGIQQMLSWATPTIAELKRFLARATASTSRALIAALPTMARQQLSIEAIERQLQQLEQTEFAPPPLLTGDDLTAAGYQPGPAFKKVLDAVYDAQLEDRVKDTPEALEMAAALFGSSPRS